VLTRHQQKALNLSCHLSVTANAGSGKTTVLARRYLDILLQMNVQVENVVAITFTEKAAGELSQRITSEVADKIAEVQSEHEKRRNSGTADRLDRLAHIRQELPSANISTIHAFCARILRQFPVEAGVDAAFTTAGTLDSARIADDALQRTFSTFTVEVAEKKERVFDTLRAVGRPATEEILRLALKKRVLLDRLVDAGMFEKTDDELLAMWEEAAARELAGQLSPHRGLFDGVVSLAVEAGALTHLLEKLFSGEESLRDRCAAIIDLGDRLLVKSWGKGREKEFKKGIVKGNADITRFAGVLGSLRGLARASDLDRHHVEAYARHLRVLIELYGALRHTYEELKEEENALDYEDLLVKTLALLREHPEIRRRLSEQYRFIMVDEYQDTDRLQYEILRPLLDEFKRGNLFIVGDPKQSIFGFRNANVAVFNSTKQEMAAAVGRSSSAGKNTTVEDEERGMLTLPDSFRLLSDILVFVNELFRDLLHDEENGVRYDELVKGRQNDDRGSVELLLVPDDSGENKEDETPGESSVSITQEEAVARRILLLVDEKATVFEKGKGARGEIPRPVRFGDVAILLRSRARLGFLEEAMKAHNIPYVVSSGVGFYQTQEIYDFANYLRFLLNPADDVALAGILRSPFFTLSDAELYTVVQRVGTGTLFDKLKTSAAVPGAPAAVKTAVECLGSDLERAGKLPIPLLVQRILLQTGWLGVIAGSPRGDQNNANIVKLLRLAREFEGRSFVNLFDFVERLNELIEKEPEEGQAAVVESRNAVQILTIHAAKGIEFPVVILPYLNEPRPRDRLPLIDEDLGIGFSVIGHAGPEREAEKVTVPVVEVMKLRMQRRSAEEEKRIFYVATTRAKDHLILTARNRRVVQGSPFDWIVRRFPEFLALPPKGPLVETRIRRLLPDGTGEEEVPYMLRVKCLDARRLEALPHEGGAPPSAAFPNDIHDEPITGQIRGEFFSATQIQLFARSRRQFMESYRTGMLPESRVLPVVERAAAKGGDESDDVFEPIDPARRGTIIHSVLSRVRSKDDLANLAAIVRSVVNREEIGREERLLRLGEEIRSEISALLRGEFAKAILGAEEIFTEYTIASALGDDFAVGIVDRLMKDPSLGWWILDYKTDDVSHERDLKAFAEDRYGVQMKCYAYLLRRLHPEQLEVRTVLWFLRRNSEPVAFVFDAAHLDEWEGELSSLIAQMKEMILSGLPSEG